MSTPRAAPELVISQWFNAPEAITLESLRGRVVVIEAFQMLCPGCVLHGLPQAARVFGAFRREDVAVVGLHCVFEHHEAQTPVSLEAFLREFRIEFPVGVDMPDDVDPLPTTMAAYNLQGTPTTVLIDRQGRRRAQHFGQVADLQLGAEIMALVGESVSG